jgi:hypothetical protein
VNTALQSSSARLAWLLFPHSSGRKLLMFVAYLDDSGTDLGSSVAVLAGYVAAVSEWERFEIEWNEFLHREGLRFYHSVECVHGSGEFKGRTDEQCRRIHKDAVQLITRHNLTAIGAAVHASRLREMHDRAKAAAERVVPKPDYDFCFQYVVVALGFHMLGTAEQVAMVLEDTPKVKGAVAESYEHLLEGPWKGLKSRFSGTPIFQPKLGFPALQAADVLAYEMGREQERAGHPPRKYPPRASWNELVKHALAQSKGSLFLYYLSFPKSEPEGL